MPIDYLAQARHEQDLRRLGTRNPVCLQCPETDPRVLELQHVAGVAFDPLQVILCRNCHRKAENSQTNETNPLAPPLLEQVGRLLVGLADFLTALVERCRTLGTEALAAARVCRWPWGWQGAPDGAA
jgi:hypothetical protein